MPFTGAGTGIQNADDVFFSGTTNGELLKYNGGTAKWNNAGLAKADIGLGNVDNTSDANKPISSATQTALNAKASTSHTHTAADVGVLTLTQAAPGARFTCLWNSGTSKWAYNGTDLNARPSGRTDIFFDLIGAPAATADPVWAIAGDMRKDV